MTDLKTSYMGLELKNPLIVSSCGLTKTLQGVQKSAESGAGAIVLKSLFEEQLVAETSALIREDNTGHSEAFEYLQGYGKALGPKEYLQLVRDAKKSVNVPVIASINCVSTELWAEYAHKLASAGADALEVNVGFLPNNPHLTGEVVETRYEQILSAVRSKIDIPVALKVGPYFSSFAHLAARLGNNRMEGPSFTVGWCGSADHEKKVTWRGADALVLFNRFYRFDIDVDSMTLAGGNPYSTSEELHVPLHWISLLAGRVNCDLAATTGVHNGEDAIKQLLAGATVVQLCSTLYRNGFGQVSHILDDISTWMKAKGFSRLDDFRGRLSQGHSERPEDYERVQYVKALVGRD